MLIDHDTRLRIAQEHADRLRETMLAAKKERRSAPEPARPEARIYAFPKARPQVERGGAAA